MSYLAFAPEVIVAVLALAALLAGPAGPVRLRPRRAGVVPGAVSAGIVIALALELIFGAALIGGAYAQDRLALFGKAAALLALLLAVAVTDWDREAVTARGWRPLGLVLVGGLGLMVVASASGLILLWAGLAVAVLAAVFVLALGEPARVARRLVAAAAGALLLALAGILIVVVSTGQSGLAQITHALAGHAPPVAVAIGVLLVVAGLGAGMAVAPIWLGGRHTAPFAVGAGFCLIVIAAGLVLAKVTGAASTSYPGWSPALQVAAVAAMAAGGFGALSVARLGRLLGWLSLTQVGWFLAALSSHQRGGVGAGLYLLAALAAAAAAGPQLIAAAEAGGLPGLSARQPWRAAALVCSLLSLAGVPPLAGFFAEFSVGAGLSRSGGFWVLTVGLGAGILGLAAVVRAVRRLFLDAAADDVRRPAGAGAATPWLAVVGAWAAALVVAGWGLLANPGLDLAVQGAAALGLR